jgi:hypothetical protein
MLRKPAATPRKMPQQEHSQPKNLDLTVFIVGRTIEALTHGAVLDRPELLNLGNLAL